MRLSHLHTEHKRREQDELLTVVKYVLIEFDVEERKKERDLVSRYTKKKKIVI